MKSKTENSQVLTVGLTSLALVIFIQQGPISFLFKRNSSSALLPVPNKWLKDLPVVLDESAGSDDLELFYKYHQKNKPLLNSRIRKESPVFRMRTFGSRSMNQIL
jgi:hypothetical protein